jgi:hypothetical protein
MVKRTTSIEEREERKGGRKERRRNKARGVASCSPSGLELWSREKSGNAEKPWSVFLCFLFFAPS